jgi:hypothetical protein
MQGRIQSAQKGRSGCGIDSKRLCYKRSSRKPSSPALRRASFCRHAAPHAAWVWHVSPRRALEPRCFAIDQGSLCNYVRSGGNGVGRVPGRPKMLMKRATTRRKSRRGRGAGAIRPPLTAFSSRGVRSRMSSLLSPQNGGYGRLALFRANLAHFVGRCLTERCHERCEDSFLRFDLETKWTIAPTGAVWRGS